VNSSRLLSLKVNHKGNIEIDPKFSNFTKFVDDDSFETSNDGLKLKLNTKKVCFVNIKLWALEGKTTNILNIHPRRAK
jgi:hypothetical protein